MRVLALALLSLAAVARAQPVTPSPPASPDHAGDAGAGVSPAYRVGMGSLLASTGAAGAGGLAALSVNLIALGLNGCGFDGCPGDPPDLDAMLVTSLAVGGIAGGTLVLRAVGQTRAEYRGILPYPGIGPDDWRRGLVGALVGTLPGIAVAVLIGPTESGAEWVALPLAQGLGAGLAIGL